MKKRILLLTALMALLVSLFGITAFAGDVDVDGGLLFPIEFYVEDAVADFDDTTIQVGIDVKRNPGLIAIQYELEYDDEAFTLSSQPTFGTITGLKIDEFSPITSSPHIGILSNEDGRNIIGNGRLLTYKFNINPEADAGTYDVVIKLSGESANGTELKVIDYDLEELETVIYNGSITIPGYTVKFDTNGGEGDFDDVLKRHGKSLTLPDTLPSKDGYDFLGWSQNSGAATAEFEAGAEFDVNADTTLYAVWKKQPYTADTLVLAITSSDATEVEGEKFVTATVSAKQNPGFNGLGFYLDYDKTRLSYVSMASTKLSVMPPATEESIAQMYLPTGDNYTQTGEIFTITFKVLDEAPFGEAKINILPEKDWCSYHDGYSNQTRKVFVEQGSFTISPPQKLGDINLDGEVRLDDAVLLFQHSMMPSLYPVGYVGNMDFDKDGRLGLADAVLLFQYSMMPGLYPIG